MKTQMRMAPEPINNKADEMHPFGFVDYDEDESEEDNRPYEAQPIAQLPFRSHLPTYARQEQVPAAAFHGGASSHSSTSSCSSSPAISGLPWLQNAEHHASAMKSRAAVWEGFHEGEMFYAGHKREAQRMINVRHGGHPEALGRAGGETFNHFVPAWQQPAMKAHEFANAQEAQNVDTKVPTLVNFAMENFELRAQIRSFSQEILQLREKLNKQEAEKQERGSNEWKSRYWSVAEHQRFLEGLKLYGKRNFKGIAAHVGSRNATQAKTHAQKYFARLERTKGGKEGANGDSAGSSSTSGSPLPDESVEG